MTLMREALTISFFMLGILSIRNNHIWRFLFWGIIAMSIHRFSIVIFSIYILYYLLFSKHMALGLMLISLFFVMAFLYKGWVQQIIGNFMFVDSIYTSDIVKYATSAQYGGSSLNWKGHLFLFVTIGFYVYILIMYNHYKNIIALDKGLFSSCIIIAIIILLIKDSFAIFYRLYDYFQTFTSMMALAWLVSITRIQRRFSLTLAIYLVFMIFPFWSIYKYYSGPWGINPSTKVCKYMEFYPYNSIIDQSKDHTREMGILNYRKLH